MTHEHLLGWNNPEEVTEFFDKTVNQIIWTTPEFSDSVGELSTNSPYVTRKISQSILSGYPTGFWELRDLSAIRDKYLKNLQSLESTYNLEAAADQTLFLLGLVRQGRLNALLHSKSELPKELMTTYIKAGRTFYMSAACGKYRNATEKNNLALMAHTFTLWIRVLSHALREERIQRMLIHVQ